MDHAAIPPAKKFGAVVFTGQDDPVHVFTNKKSSGRSADLHCLEFTLGKE
jgi:hypothetical protein